MLASAVRRTALAQKDMTSLASLMDRNFDLRLSMFGEAALGEANMKMISIARSVGGETLSYLHVMTAVMVKASPACPCW